MIVNKNSFALLLIRIRLACAIASENSSVSMFAFSNHALAWSKVKQQHVYHFVLFLTIELFVEEFYVFIKGPDKKV